MDSAALPTAPPSLGLCGWQRYLGIDDNTLPDLALANASSRRGAGCSRWPRRLVARRDPGVDAPRSPPPPAALVGRPSRAAGVGRLARTALLHGGVTHAWLGLNPLSARASRRSRAVRSTSAILDDRGADMHVGVRGSTARSVHAWATAAPPAPALAAAVWLPGWRCMVTVKLRSGGRGCRAGTAAAAGLRERVRQARQRRLLAIQVDCTPRGGA